METFAPVGAAAIETMPAVASLFSSRVCSWSSPRGVGMAAIAGHLTGEPRWQRLQLQMTASLQTHCLAGGPQWRPSQEPMTASPRQRYLAGGPRWRPASGQAMASPSLQQQQQQRQTLCPMGARRAASFMLPPGYGRQWEGPLPSVSHVSGAATPAAATAAAAGAGVRAAAWALLGSPALGDQPLPSSLQPANVPARSLHHVLSPEIKKVVPPTASVSRRLSVDARLPSSPSQLIGLGGGGEGRGQNVKRRPPFRRGSMPDLQAAVSTSIAEESE